MKSFVPHVPPPTHPLFKKDLQLKRHIFVVALLSVQRAYMTSAALASMTAYEQFNLMKARGMWTQINADTGEQEYWEEMCYVVAEDGIQVWKPGYVTEAELLVKLAMGKRRILKPTKVEPGDSSEPSNKKKPRFTEFEDGTRHEIEDVD